MDKTGSHSLIENTFKPGRRQPLQWLVKCTSLLLITTVWLSAGLLGFYIIAF